MAFKFIVALALVAAASAGLIPATQVYHAAPAAQVYHAAPAAQVYHASPAAQVYHAPPATQVYHAAPAVAVAQPVLAKNVEEYDPHPQYKFSYDVHDSITGDTKSQIEARDGDVVQGEYSLIDADGYKRTVQYTADPVHGFNAVVNREPLGVAVKTVAPIVKTVAPVAYAAPTIVKSAPLAYAAAPALIRSAPVAYAAAPTLIKSPPLAYAAPPALAYHH